METRDDRSLVVLARSTSTSPEGQEAFRALYERYKDEVYSFLARLLRDDALAEDALQEAFLRVHKSLDRHDVDRSFRAWLYQIARNVALDQLRRRRKQERMIEAEAGKARDADDGVVEAISAQESVVRAQRALLTLDPEDQALLVQRHAQGAKLALLAESFDCTERTVRNRLRRAAGRLAEAVLAGGEA